MSAVRILHSEEVGGIQCRAMMEIASLSPMRTDSRRSYTGHRGRAPPRAVPTPIWKDSGASPCPTLKRIFLRMRCRAWGEIFALGRPYPPLGGT